MKPSLDILRDHADAFLTELARAQHRYFVGRSTQLSTPQLYAEFPDLSDPETFAQLRELATASTPVWLEFVATEVEEARAVAANEAIAALEALPVLPSIGLEPQLSIRESIAAIPHERSRERRGMLEATLATTLADHEDVYARRAEAAEEVALALHASSYVGLREQVSGYLFSNLAADCERVLAQTEDAYRDALSYALRRLDATLRPGSSKRHDLLRAAVVPWLLEHFAPSDVLPAIARSLEEGGLDFRAQGRIAIDSEPGLPEGFPPRCFSIEVPDEVRVAARPRGGIADTAQFLHVLGQAQHRANTDASQPLEYRRLGDVSVNHGFGFVFENLLLDPAWNRRYLRLSQRVAKEASQMAAFVQLAALRSACAFLPCELTLLKRGHPEASAEYEERMGAALLVGLNPAFFLREFAPQLGQAQVLRGFALEAALHTALRERFNEDFWRNPAAGSWLSQLFSRGQRDDAEKLSRELGGPLQLAMAGTRLVAALNG
jgi:hypothetical protein